MVETEFSIVRFKGDTSAAAKVYDGLEPCMPLSLHFLPDTDGYLAVTAQDVAEEIVWAAARPPHVNIAELFVLPVNQATPTLNYRK